MARNRTPGKGKSKGPGKKAARKKAAPPSAAPVTTGTKKVERNEKGQIKPGSALNPNGRPKSSRHKLSENFIQALANDFEKHGIDAIQSVRRSKPGEYLRVISSIVPKQLETEDEDGNTVGVALITRGAIEAIIERGRSE